MRTPYARFSRQSEAAGLLRSDMGFPNGEMEFFPLGVGEAKCLVNDIELSHEKKGAPYAPLYHRPCINC